MKKLLLNKESVRVLVSSELEVVAGGRKDSSVLPGGGGKVSSVKPGGGGHKESSVMPGKFQPTATAIVRVKGNGGFAKPTATAVSNHGGGFAHPTATAIQIQSK